MTRYIDHPPPQARHSAAGAVGAGIAYALVALVLRFVVARAVFLFGQSMIVGPPVALSFRDWSYSPLLPARLREEVLANFAAHFANAPMSAFIATVFAYVTFLLPIFLLLGFATRFSALVLLIVTIVLQVYVDPEALWTVHAYWAAILLVLLIWGGGAISLDRLIRYMY